MPIDTLENYKKSMLENNRDYYGRSTWETAYGQINRQEALAKQQIEQQYGEAAGQAYVAAQKQRADILGSNLISGYKQEALSDIDTALSQAYESYLSQAKSSKLEVEQSAAEQKEQVTSAFEEQAQMNMDYRKATEDYFKYVYDYYAEHFNDDTNPFKNNPNWNKYLVEVGEDEPYTEGTSYMDIDGTTYRLKTMEELQNPVYDEEGNLLSPGFYDENNRLTISAVDFYEQMLNEFADKKVNVSSFDKWLSETNPELYDWSRSYNPYDYNAAGTNQGSFKTMFGMTSTDYQYSFIERWGGLSENQVKDMYSKFEDKAKELMDLAEDKGKSQGQSIVETTGEMVESLRDFTEELGISPDIDWDLIERTVSDYVMDTKNNWEMTEDFFKNFVVGVGSGGVAAASAATTTGLLASTTSIPVVGWIIGGILVAVGTVNGIIDVTEDRRINKDRAIKATNIYNSLIEGLITYSQSQAREKQIEFANRG